MNKSFLTIIFIFFSITLFGQYQLWMVDGRAYDIVDTVRISYQGIVVKTLKAEFIIDTSDVFALVGKNDTIYYYNCDSCDIKDATMFMKGQIDGLKYKTNVLNTAAFFVGFSSSVLFNYTPISSFYSPFVSSIYVLAIASIPPNKYKITKDSSLINNHFYMKGYKYGVTKKKIKNTTFYSLLGLSAGIITALLLQN